MATPDTTGRLIVVAGMHRSGTSAFTRALNLLGAHIPEPVVPAFEGNELGHWEPEAVVHMNDRFLAEAGSHVNTGLPVAAAWFASAGGRRATDEIARWLEPRVASHPLVVVKDPRIALLAPAWRAAVERIGVTPRFVMPYRHPHEVAASLTRRQLHFFPHETWPRERGLLIWLTHVVEFERATRGALRSMVAFDALLADWRPELERALAQIDLPLEIGPQAQAAIAASIRGDARREVATAGEVLPHAVRRVLDALQAATTDPNARSPAFDEAAATLADAGALLGPYLAALERAGESQGALAARAERLEAERDAARTRAGVVERRAGAVRRAASRRTAEEARLLRVEQGADDAIGALEAAHALDEARAQVDRLAGRVDALLDAHRDRATDARAVKARQARREDDLRRRLHAAEARASAADSMRTGAEAALAASRAEAGAALHAIRTQAEAALAASQAEADGAQARAAELAATLSHARDYASRLAQEKLDAVRAGVAAVEAERVVLARGDEARSAQRAGEADALAASLAEEVDARRAAQARARDLEIALAAVRASRSWRATALRRLRGG